MFNGHSGFPPARAGFAEMEILRRPCPIFQEIRAVSLRLCPSQTARNRGDKLGHRPRIEGVLSYKVRWLIRLGAASHQ
jgi:hypothetical protein